MYLFQPYNKGIVYKSIQLLVLYFSVCTLEIYNLFVPSNSHTSFFFLQNSKKVKLLLNIPVTVPSQNLPANNFHFLLETDSNFFSIPCCSVFKMYTNICCCPCWFAYVPAYYTFQKCESVFNCSIVNPFVSTTLFYWSQVVPIMIQVRHFFLKCMQLRKN